MKYVPLITLTLIGFAATPAVAQTADDPQDSSGLTIAGIAGFDDITLKDELGGPDISEEDAVYGGRIGYDVDLGRVFVGLEGEVAFSDVFTAAGDVITPGDIVSIEANETYYVGARAGFEVGSRAALYAKAGYSALQYETRRVTPTTVSIDDQHAEGLTIGGGIQFDLTDNIRLNAEYRYSDLGEIEVSGVPSGYEVERSQIMAGVGFRF